MSDIDEQKFENIQLVKNVILETVKSYINSKNVHLNLDSKTIEIINLILNQYPELFGNINDSVKSIMDDNKLDVNDIPALVLMIKDVINIDKNILEKLYITRSDAILVLEGVLIILIDENVIKTDGNKDSVKNLLKLSVKILEAGIELKTTIKKKWICC